MSDVSRLFEMDTNNLRHILTALAPSFIDRIKHVQACTNTKTKDETSTQWIEVIRATTNNKSQASIDNIIRFYRRIIPLLGRKLENLF